MCVHVHVYIQCTCTCTHMYVSVHECGLVTYLSHIALMVSHSNVYSDLCLDCAGEVEENTVPDSVQGHG